VAGGGSWSFVHGRLPPAPASVLEIGCGSEGGFVPALRREGYDAVGIDPNAPDAPEFRRIQFERYEPPQPVAAIVASNSLHHVGDLDEAAGRIHAALRADGTLVVVEWAWELFDDATAQWCFGRLADRGEPSWLHRRRDEWIGSGRPWEGYVQAWAGGHGLHPGRRVVQALDTRFVRRSYAEGPFFFPDLAGVTEEDEQAAIDTGQIRATAIRYVGTPQPLQNA
jgi:SAM-dependent methyltransferase